MSHQEQRPEQNKENEIPAEGTRMVLRSQRGKSRKVWTQLETEEDEYREEDSEEEPQGTRKTRRMTRVSIWFSCFFDAFSNLVFFLSFKLKSTVTNISWIKFFVSHHLIKFFFVFLALDERFFSLFTLSLLVVHCGGFFGAFFNPTLWKQHQFIIFPSHVFVIKNITKGIIHCNKRRGHHQTTR